MKAKSNFFRRGAFTLIELLVVIAIIAILAALWGDLHATECTTKAAFDPLLWDWPANASPSGSNADKFQKIVSLFQP